MSDARTTIRKQRGALRTFRRLTILAAFGGIIYLGMRFDFMSLPEDRLSPLVRFGPGDRLVIDGRPRAVATGDAVFILTQDRTRRLCLVDQVRAADGHLWCVTDNPDVVGFSSSAAGWIDPRAVVGRVLLAWTQ